MVRHRVLQHPEECWAHRRARTGSSPRSPWPGRLPAGAVPKQGSARRKEGDFSVILWSEATMEPSASLTSPWTPPQRCFSTRRGGCSSGWPSLSHDHPRGLCRSGKSPPSPECPLLATRPHILHSSLSARPLFLTMGVASCYYCALNLSVSELRTVPEADVVRTKRATLGRAPQ